MPATFGRSLVLLLVLVFCKTPLAAGQLLSSSTSSDEETSSLSAPPDLSKLDPLLQSRLSNLEGHSRVIAAASTSTPIESVATLIREAGGTTGRQLPIVRGIVADVPNASLAALSGSALVQRIALDRSVYGSLNRTSGTVGAGAARQELGYDGSGIGVAVIDSGVTPWHDDLASSSDPSVQRVDAFVDFVRGETASYDDYGHGTHVAGIIAGNGFDSGGARAGIAPGARLVVLKVLDGAGRGRISDVIAAIGYAVDHKETYRIRVINLSIGAGVFESCATDMLTLAAKGAVDAGIVVVASAGNFGKDPYGRPRYGGITAPGNAPWVLTVGASSHMGTVDRGDDVIATFSSRGPTAIDYNAKPDLLAPGVGIESLSDPASAMFTSKAHLLLSGSVETAHAPYLSLSGTSQAAPVVAGVVALMLQANPSLTPNAVKAILQFTAHMSWRYDPLTQGAGFLDGRGSIELARFLSAPGTYPYPSSAAEWGGQLMWGNRRVWPGVLTADAAAWRPDVIWGALSTPTGLSVTWGGSCNSVVCATLVSADPQMVPTEASDLTLVTPLFSIRVPSDNIVWGSACGGANCDGTSWPATDVVSTSDEGDTVVWGSTGDGDTVVWGSSDSGDTVVWGSSDDGDTVVWGSSGDEDVVWSSSAEEPASTPEH